MNKNCHHATEVYPDLLLGGLDDVPEMVDLGADVLVPLDHLPADVWSTGFRGEILYCPAPDMGVLPRDVLDRLVDAVIQRLGHGRAVGIFCLGGHGRTGYVVACVLSRLGVKEPVAYLRRVYCHKAVETARQMDEVLSYSHQSGQES